MNVNSSEIGRDAAMFAAGAHAGQKYGEDLPYYFHLKSTVDVLTRFLAAERMVSDILVAAAWLHDTMEDTKVRYDDIFRFFGERIANIIDAVTDRAGENRRARHAATYPVMRFTGGDDAVLVKLADRIANVEYSLAVKDGGKVKMYRKEWDDFQLLIGRSNATHVVEVKMWAHLASLMEKRS
jgi:(p)ppGpp synthase/HD superfamily hydrolase